MKQKPLSLGKYKAFLEANWLRIKARAMQDFDDYIYCLTPEACMAKFQKGRKEHKDDLMKLDVDEEMLEEVKDILNYAAISILQNER